MLIQINPVALLAHPPVHIIRVSSKGPKNAAGSQAAQPRQKLPTPQGQLWGTDSDRVRPLCCQGTGRARTLSSRQEQRERRVELNLKVGAESLFPCSSIGGPGLASLLHPARRRGTWRKN